MNIWSVCTPKINRMFPTLMTVNIQSVHQSVSQFILLTRHTKATISSPCCVLIPKLPSLWLNEHLIPMLSSHPQGTIIMAESNRYCHSGLTSWWCHPDGAIQMVPSRWCHGVDGMPLVLDWEGLSDLVRLFKGKGNGQNRFTNYEWNFTTK